MSKSALKNIHKLIKANKAESDITVGEAFINDFNAGIEKLELEKHRKPSAYYKPSSMQCIRNMYFQATETDQDEERKSSSLIGILQSGSDRHKRLQKAALALKAQGIEYIDVAEHVLQNKLDHLEIIGKDGYETKLLWRDLNLSFMCDGIIRYKGKTYILEIKTESMYKWTNRKDYDETHIPQGVAYSFAFHITNVMFLYENRDNCAKLAFPMVVTRGMKDKFLETISKCNTYVKNKVVPPKLLEDKSPCRFCNYKTACKAAGA